MKKQNKRQLQNIISRIRTCFELKFTKTNVKSGPQNAGPQRLTNWKSL